ncbi:MAG: hypothetical protein HY319_05775 [Armatimonadetes bacterium]|nr:hypothetical protein [Armatimonadota bacterium]
MRIHGLVPTPVSGNRRTLAKAAAATVPATPAPPPPGVEVLRSLQEHGFGLWEDRGTEVITFTRVEVPLTPTEFARGLQQERPGLSLGRGEQRIPVADLGQVKRIAALHGCSSAELSHPEAGARLELLAASGWKIRENRSWRPALTFEQGYQCLADGQALLLVDPGGRELEVRSPQEAVEVDYLFGSGGERGLENPDLARQVREAVPPEFQLEALRSMRRGPAVPEAFALLCHGAGDRGPGIYRRLVESAYAASELVRAAKLVGASAEVVDYLARIPAFPEARGRRLAVLEGLLSAGAAGPGATRCAEFAEIQVDGSSHADRLRVLQDFQRCGSSDLPADYEALLKHRSRELPAAGREYAALIGALSSAGRAERAADTYARLQEGEREGRLGSGAMGRFLTALAVSGSVDQALREVESGPAGKVVVAEDEVQVGSVRLPRRS